MLAVSAGCATLSRTLQPFGLATPAGYAYDVRIVGVGGQLADRLEEVSVLFLKRGQPPATLQGLRRRTQSDRDLYLRVLRSRGFYDGTVTWEIDATKRPAVVSMNVTRGVRYKFSRFDIQGLPPEAASLATAGGLASLGIAAGEAALAETVLAVEARIVTTLASRGYPYAELPTRVARIDRLARTMEVVVQVDAGPHARFGPVTVDGLARVKESLVLRRLKFERGEAFSPEKVETTRKALFATGVFSSVGLTWGKRSDVAPNGEAPVRIVVTEGKMHTVGAGVKYSSADGPGGRAFWEHRNLFGRAERLRGEIDYSERVTTGGVSFRKPDLFRVDQSLLLDATLHADDPPAYDREAASLSGGLERRFSSRLVATGGLAVEQSDVNSAADADGTKRYTLIGVPLGVRYDASDNLLDPARGHRTMLSVNPWFSVLGDNVEMLALRATESFYIPIDDKRRRIWATRISIGSIIGPQRKDIPADKRLYAGGGDSVRGYEFQKVGPLRDIDPLSDDPTGKPRYKPLGGRSLLQLGTELRWKVSKNIGVVPFVEGAGIYRPGYPDFSGDMQWAAGLGLRYFTVAGPIRVDVGFPLNPRQSDDIFQIYISLGQAF